MKRLLLAAALATAAFAAFAAPTTYKIDPNHTDVIAGWSHFGFSNPIAHFGQVVARALYGEEEAVSRQLVELMRLEKDQSLTMEEKAVRAQQLRDSMQTERH